MEDRKRRLRPRNALKQKKRRLRRSGCRKGGSGSGGEEDSRCFWQGNSNGNKGTGTTGSGLEGSPTGNSSEGKSGGVGGYGTFDLNGRSLGSGGLPMPVYNVQDEGRVVVTIYRKSRRTGDKYQYQQTYQIQ